MKSVLITGANKGIGLETAKQLSAKGILVYLGCRDIEKGQSVAKELTLAGFRNIRPVKINVTDIDTILEAKRLIEGEKGSLDILINNAGISGILPQTAVGSAVKNYQEVIDVNFYGVVRTTQAFLELLKKTPEPRIVNVSTSVGSLSLQSNTAWPAYDYAKYAIYASSKAAMNMYTIHLAYELRNTAFRINAVCPGYTKTDFTNQSGGDVKVAGQRIVRFALINQEWPTGKFFSEETNPESSEITW